jgi:hypothetical protein
MRINSISPMLDAVRYVSGMESRKPLRLAGLALLLPLLTSACGYNEILGADEDVKARWAQVQSQYQRRMDLIPNLVNTASSARRSRPWSRRAPRRAP